MTLISDTHTSKSQPDPWSDFIPGTSERAISWNRAHQPVIVFRPIRGWSSNTYAGEGITSVQSDRRGYLNSDGLCHAPYVVTHRIYWHKVTNARLSAFLSYPGAMGYFGSSLPGEANDKGTYFWELYPDDGDVSRWSTENELEARVRQLLRKARS